MRRTPAAAFIAFAAMALLLGARTRPSRPPAAEPLTPVDFTRALEITDKPIVGAFSLDRILAQLIARSGVAGLTPQQMMRLRSGARRRIELRPIPHHRCAQRTDCADGAAPDF